jgi:TorA maturation chaperone TorD
LSDSRISDAESDATTGIFPEEQLRANTYALLAVLLREPPGAEALGKLAALEPDDSEMGRALGALAGAAREASVEDIDDEFHDLFVGVGESELKPYGSYYLTGFMYEKPLAKLRAEMAALGLGRADDVPEPEDHAAALCEAMCALITGEFGAPETLARQRAFFDTHIAPWFGRFFEDMETSPSARFYRPLGTVGRLFMRIETQSFEMAA